MPYQKPGCQTCRIQRVKCDGDQPTCGACAKAKRICIERVVARPSSLSIQSENAYASARVKRPRGPRPSLTLLRPHFDLESGAKSYFLNHYMSGLPDSPSHSACFSECVVGWRRFKRQSAMMDLAVSSVALAIYSQTQNSRLAAEMACRSYCRLLRIAQRQIIERQALLEEDGVDECLVTIMLMALYETTMHQPRTLESDSELLSRHSWSHHGGAMAILEMWHEKIGSGNAPSLIVKQARQGLIRSALLRNIRLPDWMQNGDRFHAQKLDSDFDSILFRIVNLRHSFKALEGSEAAFNRSEVARLAMEASNLEQEYLVWASLIPSIQMFREHSVECAAGITPEDVFSSSVLYSFECLAYAASWLQYLALHVVVVSTRLGLLKADSSSKVTPFGARREEEQLTARLATFAANFASTVPFSLGRFDVDVDNHRGVIVFRNDTSIQPALALPAVLPVVILSSIDGIDSTLQLWFRAQLADLAGALGDGALRCAVTKAWAHDI